jgi:hypothetical protein
MQKQKLIKLLFLFLVLASLLPNACTKRFEEDPFTMHFVRMRKRITGEWHMKKILIDGQDFTHLIYTDTVPFYSIYVFSEYSRIPKKGTLEIKSYDNRFIIDKYAFRYLKYNMSLDKQKTISFYTVTPTNDTLSDIFSYGPINKFGGNTSSWNIWNLTKKNMHLSTNFQNQYYELFFEKK